jgi:serine/threonine protein kinase
VIEKKKISGLIDNEVKILKLLNSHGLLRFYESFEHHNHRYIAMELIEG